MAAYTDLGQEKQNVDQYLPNSLTANKIKDEIKMTKDQDPCPSPSDNPSKRYNRKIHLRPTKLSPMILSASQIEAQDEATSAFEAHVRELIENLKSTSLETVRESVCELWRLSKEMDNRILIASCGAIDPLVALLHSSDLVTQENAVTAILQQQQQDQYCEG